MNISHRIKQQSKRFSLLALATNGRMSDIAKLSQIKKSESSSPILVIEQYSKEYGSYSVNCCEITAIKVKT